MRLFLEGALRQIRALARSGGRRPDHPPVDGQPGRQAPPLAAAEPHGAKGDRDGRFEEFLSRRATQVLAESFPHDPHPPIEPESLDRDAEERGRLPPRLEQGPRPAGSRRALHDGERKRRRSAPASDIQARPVRRQMRPETERLGEVTPGESFLGPESGDAAASPGANEPEELAEGFFRFRGDRRGGGGERCAQRIAAGLAGVAAQRRRRRPPLRAPSPPDAAARAGLVRAIALSGSPASFAAASRRSMIRWVTICCPIENTLLANQ